MIKKLLFFILLFCSFGSGAQIKNFLLYGTVRDSIGVVKDVNVFNITAKKGTFTNDFGVYQMTVSEGDSLKFSSIQHKDLIRIVTSFTVEKMFKDVYLERNTIQLDEIILSNTILDGLLISDRKKTPVDQRMEQLKKNMDLSKYNMRERAPDDHISSKVKPPQTRGVDPTTLFAGAGAGVGIAWKNSAKLWALRRELDYKSNFPTLLKQELGVNFFRDELKIPDDKYYNFLEYCAHLDISDIYKRDKLKVIQILKKESKTYLALNSKTEKTE